MKTFKEWLSTRQDARTWSEDEIAVAELAWKSATASVLQQLRPEGKNEKATGNSTANAMYGFSAIRDR
jgi:hypothetical protein